MQGSDSIQWRLQEQDRIHLSRTKSIHREWKMEEWIHPKKMPHNNLNTPSTTSHSVITQTQPNALSIPFSPQNNSFILPPLFTAITQHNNHHSLITQFNHNHTPLSPFLVPFRLQSTSKQSIAPNYQIPCISMDKWRSKMIGWTRSHSSHFNNTLRWALIPHRHVLEEPDRCVLDQLRGA